MLLEQPGFIGGLRLKNRVVMAPMGTNYSTTDGLSTERDKQYYAERARGGVGMIMTEAMVVTERARPHNNSLCCYHDRFIPGLASIVDAIKQHDCHVFGQLNHRGALLRRSVLNMEPVGPSPWFNPNTGDEVRALAVREIVEIQKLFVAAARRLWLAGYDGVEIHAANGYLFQQFFSPRINHRDDAYGGSLANRMRLLLETMRRLRDALPDLRLVIRLSASEFAQGGYTEADIVALAQAVEQEGADAIDLSGGSNESPQLSKFCIQPPSFPRGCLADTARPIKQAVKIPVFVAGRIVEPADAEAVLASGSADFVSVGRALYADPHWCLKAFGKLDAPIRQCIACNVCFERLTLEKDVSCATNPMIGTEFEALEHAEPQLFAAPSEPRQRVLVLGAGIAGMEAARILKGRGHDVEVWEKGDAPGGQVPLAIAAPDKMEVEPVWSYRWNAARRLGVRVLTGIEADAARIRAHAPDYVVVATGAQPAPPPMDVGALAPAVRVLHAWELLADLEALRPGMKATIVGGGMVGAETADALRERGVHVTLVEIQATIANGMARNNKFELVERLAAGGARILTQCRILRVLDRHLEVQMQGEPPCRVEIGDMLVFATGPRPRTDAVAAVQAADVPYARVGDCNAPGDFLAALRDAWMVALSVDARARRSAARRSTALLLASGLLLACILPLSGLAVAGPYPDRPVRLIVPFPPGGGTDILARPMAQKLGEKWGQPVVIENRAGAGGNIGTEAGARAPADGYTLVLGTVGTHAINQSLYRNLPFDATRDTVAITLVANTPNILVLNPAVPARSVQDLIALAKAKPGVLNYASPGNGTPPHLAAEIFKSMAGVSITHVPYKGSGPAMTDLLGGQVQMMIANAPVVIPLIRNGKLKGLASTSARRPSMLRDMPTLAESGLKGYEADTWYGLFAPAGTPLDVVTKLNADVVAVLKSPEIEHFFNEQGAEVIADSSDDANAKVRSEVQKWRDVIHAIGLKTD
ncbi:tripartite tricarboxylate transporter substrate-binding protein [Achromobacter aloeverae]|uniref:NADH:flavin oxidoreductase n=1 Tax=Achromobacter aloeverae TaxID=1750518 RepID=A0A4Q1HI92_9BURK|nr:tripartite tricarboxylate transporter substrate-binding protein [Achromobacter aloeverae]RXN85966.1 hypothetical protein C7R54_19585 [Achromobacter aloeverae]